MASFGTEQEEFWAGEFGDSYINRNNSDLLVAANIKMFVDGLRAAGPIRDVIEFGSNIGLNLRALRTLYPGQEQYAIEINPNAATILGEAIGKDHVYNQSLLDFSQDRQWDLVLVKGVLIHLNPDRLADVYRKLFKHSRKYVLLCEYYNPSPVSITYRGHQDRLFKRDFCGEMMDMFPELKLRDYGFAYRRDPVFPQDDITWFLLEKP